MAKPGRKAKPTASKALAGNPGQRPLNDSEPVAPAGVPECPDSLDDVARTEWYHIVPMLQEMRVLTKADKAMLAAYCSAWSEFDMAEKLIAKRGFKPVSTTPRGTLQAHPAIAMRRHARDQIRKLASEFGLSPSSRSGLHAIPDGNGKDTKKEALAKRLHIA